MRRAIASIGIAVVISLSACGSLRYFVPAVQISRDGRISAVGARYSVEPTSGSYYAFDRGARLNSVTHLERKTGDSELHILLYLETSLDDRLDRTVKKDVLLAGDFGLVYSEKTCFYNRPVESNYSSVRIGLYSNEYRVAFEDPTELAGAPDVVSQLTSASLVKMFRDRSAYTLVAADYELTGERRSFHIAQTTGGELKPGNSVSMFQLDSNDPRLEQYGIPDRLDIRGYLASHRLRLPSRPTREQKTWLIEFYDWGRLIQLQELRGGVAVTSRWFRPSVTKEERIIGPECDSRISRQKTMGLPTTGY